MLFINSITNHIYMCPYSISILYILYIYIYIFTHTARNSLYIFCWLLFSCRPDVFVCFQFLWCCCCCCPRCALSLNKLLVALNWFRFYLHTDRPTWFLLTGIRWQWILIAFMNWLREIIHVLLTFFLLIFKCFVFQRLFCWSDGNMDKWFFF